jgi:large repetitive protein
LSANVGGVAEPVYTFEWFSGQNTLPVNLIGTTSSLVNISAGTYTVKAIQVATGCADTAEVTIVNNLVPPVVTASVISDQSVCTIGRPERRSLCRCGGNATAGYTFYWFDGNIGTPDTAGQ